MMGKSESINPDEEFHLVDVVESGKGSKRKHALICVMGENISFDMTHLQSFFFKEWEELPYDALVVAAAVEFCDRLIYRPRQDWSRPISLRIPVNEPDLWASRAVSQSLENALNFLTGDVWKFTFYRRAPKGKFIQEGLFNLERDIFAIAPFSDGLDSCMAARLAAKKLKDRIVRVRLGTADFAPEGVDLKTEPFAAVPYNIKKGQHRFKEYNTRSRGFKFALISGMAAYFAGAKEIIVPESGQGMLGPVLAPVGQAWPDYRCHPRFGRKMEIFIGALFENFQAKYVYPHMWKTKGETLIQFLNEFPNNNNWIKTRTCWQPNTKVSVNNKARQCGICASCLMRRVSIFTASREIPLKKKEPNNAYVWENLSASEFKSGASADFDEEKNTGAMREHAIAGVLHMDHLANFTGSATNQDRIRVEAFWLSKTLDKPNNMSQDAFKGVIEENLKRMLVQHKKEWEKFMDSLGKQSFVLTLLNGASA